MFNACINVKLLFLVSLSTYFIIGISVMTGEICICTLRSVGTLYGTLEQCAKHFV